MTRRVRRPGWWPTAEQDQLLRAALLTGDESRAAWDAWQTSVDITRIDEGSARLLPLLSRHGARLAMAPPLASRLRDRYRNSWSHNQVLFRQVAALLGAFRESGIDTMLLKGVALAVLHYRDDGARPMADVDLLVRPATVRASVDVLGRCGWWPQPEPLSWPAEPRHAWIFVDRDGREIDLHWRVFATAFVSDDDLWTAAVPLRIGGETTRALSPADQFLHIVVHGLLWNPVPAIRWAADAVMVVRSAGGALDWHRVVDQASARGYLPTLDRALTYLSDRLAVGMPASVIERMRAQPPTRTERLALWAQMHAGVTAGACRLWFDYVVYAKSTARPASLVGFWNYLRAFWQLERHRSVPAMMVDKVRQRLRRSRAAECRTVRRSR
jgi:hypothetical protein